MHAQTRKKGFPLPFIPIYIVKKRLENLKKRGQEVPGPSKKVLGLLDFFGPGTTGPQDLQGL